MDYFDYLCQLKKTEKFFHLIRFISKHIGFNVVINLSFKSKNSYANCEFIRTIYDIF